MIKNILKHLRLNKIVRNFILSDMLLFSGWGLVAPVFSIFIIEKIAGATLVTVGISTALYWAVRSLIQLPLAAWLDKTDGEKDDFYTLIFGLLLISLSAVLFVAVRTEIGLYLVQGLHAVGFALYAPAWSAIFSRHLDRRNIALDWSLNSTSLGVASGVAGFLGAIIAEDFGFNSIFISAFVLSFLAAVIIFLVPDLFLPPPRRTKPVRLDHSPLTTS